MAETNEAAWERMAAVCEAAGVEIRIVDTTPEFQAWWERYSECLVASTTVPDHVPTEFKP